MQCRSKTVAGLLAFGLWLGFGFVTSTAHGATQHQLSVRVIHGASGPVHIDPALTSLAKDLKLLKFTAYRLKDEATFKLAAGSSGRMQLPGSEWMQVQVVGPTDDGKHLRLLLAVEKLEFKAQVAVATGATLILRGPDFQGGTLILAVSRPKD